MQQIFVRIPNDKVSVFKLLSGDQSQILSGVSNQFLNVYTIFIGSHIDMLKVVGNFRRNIKNDTFL